MGASKDAEDAVNVSKPTCNTLLCVSVETPLRLKRRFLTGQAWCRFHVRILFSYALYITWTFSFSFLFYYILLSEVFDQEDALFGGGLRCLVKNALINSM